MFTDTAIKEALPPFFSSYYITYDDTIDESYYADEIEALMKGDSDPFVEKFEDAMLECRSDNIAEEIAEVATRLGLASVHDLDKADRDTIREALDAMDDSTDTGIELLKRLRALLFWAVPGRLGTFADALHPGASSGSNLDDEGLVATVRVNALRVALATSGLAWHISSSLHDEEFTKSLYELVDNGPYDWHEGVRLELIWYGSPMDAAIDAGTESKRFEIDSPNLLLSDRMSGSGYDIDLSGRIQFVATVDNPVRLDSAHGYSWDETCGLVMSAYARDLVDVAARSKAESAKYWANKS